MLCCCLLCHYTVTCNYSSCASWFMQTRLTIERTTFPLKEQKYLNKLAYKTISMHLCHFTQCTSGAKQKVHICLLLFVVTVTGKQVAATNLNIRSFT